MHASRREGSWHRQQLEVEAGCMNTARVFDGLPFGVKRTPSQFTIPCEPENP